MGDQSTVDDLSLGPEEAEPPLPGVLVVYSAGTAMLRALPLQRGRLVLGRDETAGALEDARTSRQHTELVFDGSLWTIRDLGSRNGTFVDGRAIEGPAVFAAPQILRLGSTLCLFELNVRPYLGHDLTLQPDLVAGPALHGALGRIAHLARTSERLLIVGESGSGKELAARRFHSAGPNASGRFVAVNCAAIPEGVAERLLFGSLKGAYSGASADADGYAQAAHGGVLFLDEIGELDLEVQAKLLRMLESHEVMPLGAAMPRKLNTRVCFATHRDLRGAVAQKQFREDLYYRIIQALVRLPPLRRRREEIPHLIARELSRLQDTPQVHVRLVEACLLRPWPGNVRELIGSVRHAVGSARAAGASLVRAEYLDPDAGMPVAGELLAIPANATLARKPEPTREAIEAALVKHDGNMAATARALGVHRTQLYRLVERYGIKGPND
jgi:DNA-binding NtrC family response regulator